MRHEIAADHDGGDEDLDVQRDPVVRPVARAVEPWGARGKATGHRDHSHCPEPEVDFVDKFLLGADRRSAHLVLECLRVCQRLSAGVAEGGMCEFVLTQTLNNGAVGHQARSARLGELLVRADAVHVCESYLTFGTRRFVT